MTINGNAPKPVKLTATVESISPEVAGRLLGTMVRNRAQRRNKINQFARAMFAGEWQLNGEPVILSADGKVIDGQHRLQAVMLAKVTVPMLVVRGAMPEAISTIDTGSTRHYGDIVTLRDGGAYGSQLAAVARRWWFYENTEDQKTFKVALSHTEIDHIISQHPLLWESVSRAANSRFRKYLTPSVFGFVHNYLAEKEDRDIAELFVATLERGADLAENNPLLVLRNRLIDATRITPVERLALTIKAYNIWIEGHTIKILSFNNTETFPRFGVTTSSARARRRKAMRAEGHEIAAPKAGVRTPEQKAEAAAIKAKAIEETKAALDNRTSAEV